MSRIKWFEFHQQDWLPDYLKVRQLEGIFQILKSVGFDQSLLTLFRKLQANTNAEIYLDLGSGAGNVMRFLAEECGRRINFILSDINPKIDSYQLLKQTYPQIDYIPQSVDIATADVVLKGKAITMISTFHELDQKQAQRAIGKLFRHSRGFLIIEPFSKWWKQMFLFPAMLVSLFLVPFRIRPWSTGMFIFTWLIPLLPLMHMHDGLVSWLRSYGEKDFRQMIHECSPVGWEWELNCKGWSLSYLLAWRNNEV
ncbi:MAG: class I SAM-dependent methyltransferase [candidate division Zixibacteria bacterium]|nr:class I SAM-dependent methyltransferase [candidate division Zixibacteria bacterium]